MSSLAGVLEELSEFVRARTGWTLNNSELARLYSKYADDSSEQVDLARLVEDIRKGMILNQHNGQFVSQAALDNASESLAVDPTGVQTVARPTSANSVSVRPSSASAGNGSGKMTSRPNSANRTKRPLRTFDQLIASMALNLAQRINSMPGNDTLHKAYMLLAESRSPVATRLQLKIALQSRLSLFLHDAEIDELFAKLDVQCEGVIKIRPLIDMLLKRFRDDDTMLSLQLPSQRQSQQKQDRPKSANARASPPVTSEQSPVAVDGTVPSAVTAIPMIGTSSLLTQRPAPLTWDESSTATMTYDKRILGLQAPHISICRPFSVEEVEAFIWERVFERSSLSDNMVKTLSRLFNNGEAYRNSEVTNTISLDLLRFTLWKRLKMNISDADVQRFFQRYAAGKDSMDMSALVDGIIRSHTAIKPLLEDRLQSRSHQAKSEEASPAKLRRNRHVDDFLLLVRKQLDDLTNRESRAPHYLLHCNDRMTVDQAKVFFLNKLLINFEKIPKTILDAIYAEYVVDRLLDIKRILVEAMSFTEDRIRSAASKPVVAGPTNMNHDDARDVPVVSAEGAVRSARELDVVGKLANQSLANGPAVSVNKQPSSLQCITHSPKQIEEWIVAKCEERLTNGHPHATLFKLFRDDSNASSSNTSYDQPANSNVHLISRKGMKSVLQKFDIIVTPEEFDAFFNKNQRSSDGKIDVHDFLHRIFPSLDMINNAFLPKDQSTLRQEQSLAHAVEELTGKRREVSALNGPSHTRVETSFLHDLQESISPKSGALPQTPQQPSPILLIGHNSTAIKTLSNPFAVNESNKQSAGTSNGVADDGESVRSSSSIKHTAKSPSLTSKPSAFSPAASRRRVEVHQEDVRSAAVANKDISDAKKKNDFTSKFYSGDFQVGTTSDMNNRVGDDVEGKKQLAETLIHAIRDLSYMPSSPPRSPRNANAAAKTLQRPQSAGAVRTDQHRWSTSSHPKERLTRGDGSSIANAPRNEYKGNNNQTDNNRLKVAKPRPRSADVSHRRGVDDANRLDDPEYYQFQSENMHALAKAYESMIESSQQMHRQREQLSDEQSVAVSRSSQHKAQLRAQSAPPRSRLVIDTARDADAQSPHIGSQLPKASPHTPTSRSSSPLSSARTSSTTGKASRSPLLFTYSGQHRKAEVDPNKETLRMTYKVVNQNCETTHLQYGAFFKDYERAMKKRNKLYSKQKQEQLALAYGV